MTTHLLPISLKGVKTAQVESLPSYIHRVAFDHGVYVGELMRYVYSKAVSINQGRYEVALPRYMTVPEMVRPERTTRMLVELFETLTKQDLGQSVLWCMNDSLGRSLGEVSSGFRWCPECISEMMSAGQEPYFKLIWHMTAVKACPIHRSPLIEKCEFCQCSQVSYRKQGAIEYCQECGRCISNRKHRLKLSDIHSSWEDIGVDIVQLFHDIAELEPYSLPKNGVRQSLDQIFDYYWRTNREEEFYRVWSRDELLAVIHGQTKISLIQARRIAYRLGISLYELISGMGGSTTDSLNMELFCKLPPGYLEASAKTKKDHRAIMNKVKRILKSSDHPPALKEVALKACVSVGYLDYRYPVLSREIVSRHKAYCEEKRLKKIYHAQEAALRFFLSEKYSDQPQSRKQAYRTLREETGLPKFVLKKAIQTAYLAIN